MDKMEFSADWHNSQRFWKTVLGLFLCLGLLTASSTADDRFRSGSTSGLILRGKNIPKSSPNVCRYGTSQYCCPGWLQLYPNGPCTQPICKGVCGEGRCIASNSCRCPDGRIRHTCLRDTPSSTHQRYVNVDDTKTACEDLRCHQHCSVYLDKAFCSCMRGYHLGIDGRHCQDINECHGHNVPCHQRCVNTPGSFRCSCFEGYVLTSNGRTCRRINDHSIDGACKDRACEERTSEIQSDTPDRLLSSTWPNSRPNTLVNQRHVIDGGQGQPLFTDDEFQKAFGDYFRGSNTESANERLRFGRSAARRGPSWSVVGSLQRPLQSEVQPNYDRRVPVVEFRRGSSVIQASLHTGRQLGQTSTNQKTYGQTFSGTQGHQSQYPARNRQGYPSRGSQSNQGYHTYSTQDSRPTHQSSFNAQGSRTYGQSSQGSSSYGQTSSSRHSSRLDPGQHVSFTNGRASVSVGLHHTFDPENQDQGQRSTSYQDQGQSSTQYQGRGSSGYDGTSGRVASATSGGRLTNSGRDQKFTNSGYHQGSSGSGFGGFDGSSRDRNYRGQSTDSFSWIGPRSTFGLGSVSQGSMGEAFRGPAPNYRGSATSGFGGPESPRSMNNMGNFPSRDGARGSQGQYFLNDGRTLVNQRTGDDSSKTPAQNPFPDLSDLNRKVFIDTSRQFSSPQSGSSQYQGLRGGGGSRSSFKSGASQIPGGTQYLGSNAQSQSQFPGGAAQKFQPNSNGQVPFPLEGNTFVDTSKQFSSVGQPGIPPDGFPFQSNQQGKLGKQYIQLPDGSFVEDTSGRAIQGQVQVQGQSQGCLDTGNLNGGQTQNGGCGGATQGVNSGPGGAVVDLSTDGRPYTDPNAQIFQHDVDKIPTCGNSGQAGNGQTGGCANPTGLANQGANENPTYDQLTNWNDFNQYIGQVGQGFNQQGSQRVGCGTAGGQPNWNVNVGRWEEPIGPLPYGPVNCNGGGNGGRLPCGNNGEVSCTGPGYETDLPTRGSTGNTGAGGQLPCGARGETSCTGPSGQPINGQNGQLPCGSNGEISCTGPQFGSQSSSNQFGGSQTGGIPVDQSGNYLGIGRSTVIENPNGFPIDMSSLQTGGNTDGFPIDSGNGNGNGFPIDSGNGNDNGFPIDSGDGNGNGFPIDSGNGNGNGFPIDAGKGNGNVFPISSGTGTGGDSRLGTFPIDIEMIEKPTDGSTDSRTPGEVAIPTETADRVPEGLTFPIDSSSVEGSDVIGKNWPSGIPDSSGGTRAKPMVIDRLVEFRAQVPHFGGEEGPQRGDIQVGTDSSDSRNVRITANGASILCTGPACRGQLQGQGDNGLSFQCPRGKVPRLTKYGIACMLLEDLEEPACKPQCANGGTCGGGKCVCPPGITGPTCNYDIDECTILSTTAQRCPFKCENTFGSYRCVCPPGQTLNSDGRSCKTVECFPRCLNKGKCVEGKCECPPEFKGRYCQSDVNECKDNSSLCQFYCRNTFGGYACLCPPGSRLEPDKRSCTQETCPHECQKGGVCVKGRCRCPPGYHGLTCQLDINECTHFKPCSHECVNSIGSFSCSCPEGLVLKYDARTCQNATLAAAELDMK